MTAMKKLTDELIDLLLKIKDKFVVTDDTPNNYINIIINTKTYEAGKDAVAEAIVKSLDLFGPLKVSLKIEQSQTTEKSKFLSIRNGINSATYKTVLLVSIRYRA